MSETEIAAALPSGKTYAEALARAVSLRTQLWNDRWSLDEDLRLRELRAYCVRLCGGNAAAGKALMNNAIWS